MKPTVIPHRLHLCVLLVALGSCASSPESTAPATEEPQVQAAEARATNAQSPEVARLEVVTLEFRTEIAAPVEKVWDTMLSAEGYTQWTVPFMSGSYFEGSWSEGARMRFLAPGGSGMVAEIAAYRPHEIVSIKHLGYVWNGVEDTTSDGVRSWAPAYETYRFATVSGGTVVTVEQDALPSYEAYMSNAWPKALAALKSMCEAK